MLQVVQKQKSLYVLALPGFMAYATAAVSSKEYVAQLPNASKYVHYKRLFEELITVLL